MTPKPMSRLLMLGLVLSCLALPAVASNVISDQPAPDVAASANDDTADEPAPGAAAVKTSATGSQDKEPIRRSTGEASVRPPRWHSFLPGMFR